MHSNDDDDNGSGACDGGDLNARHHHQKNVNEGSGVPRDGGSVHIMG